MIDIIIVTLGILAMITVACVIMEKTPLQMYYNYKDAKLIEQRRSLGCIGFDVSNTQEVWTDCVWLKVCDGDILIKERYFNIKYEVIYKIQPDARGNMEINRYKKTINEITMTNETHEIWVLSEQAEQEILKAKKNDYIIQISQIKPHIITKVE